MSPILETANQEAVRGGYAMRHMRLESTRTHHAVDNGRGLMYLCGCMRGFVFGKRMSNLGRNRNRDRRFAWGYRYK